MGPGCIDLASVFYIAIVSCAIGIGIGACLFSRPKRHRNTTAPYFKGEGDPQPFGEWRPELADLLRRRGAV